MSFDFENDASESDNEYNKYPTNIVIRNVHLHVTKQIKKSREFNIQLLTSVSSLDYYSDLLDLFRSMSSDDKANVYLNNFGGSVHTGIDIINAMKASKAEVHTIVTGPVYSMAPLIALQGKTVRLEPSTFMMFHDYSSLEMGKGNEIEARVNHMRKFFTECVTNWTKGFLTKSEVNHIMAGQDLYVEHADCAKRLKAMGKLG